MPCILAGHSSPAYCFKQTASLPPYIWSNMGTHSSAILLLSPPDRGTAQSHGRTTQMAKNHQQTPGTALLQTPL